LNVVRVPVNGDLGLDHRRFHVPKPARSVFRRIGVGLMLVDNCGGFFQGGL
jgi:hypothetical protein